MVEEYRTGHGQVDIVDDDNMVRLPRQRIVDMYKNAMSRVRVLEAKANEGTVFSLQNAFKNFHYFCFHSRYKYEKVIIIYLIYGCKIVK